jgi:hypothetical protein
MAKKVTGGCACGSIRYQLLDKPMFVHCCHCDDCQRLTGSAFVLNAIIETQAIKLLSGKPVAVRAVRTTSTAALGVRPRSGANTDINPTSATCASERSTSRAR